MSEADPKKSILSKPLLKVVVNVKITKEVRNVLQATTGVDVIALNLMRDEQL